MLVLRLWEAAISLANDFAEGVKAHELVRFVCVDENDLFFEHLEMLRGLLFHL